MAAVIVPSASHITFGCPSYTGLLVQSASIKASSGKKEIADQTGEIAALVFFQKKYDVSVEGYATTFAGASVGSAAASLGALSIGGVTTTGTTFMNSVSAQASNSDATKISLEGTAYDTITATS
ncbi:MAG: hypothetical protein RLZZ244_1851 [Verrucomicrobiota bacterium]|jgi:hypothetical protein